MSFHVMLDIESISTHSHNALVLSVGAVRFFPNNVSSITEWLRDNEEDRLLVVPDIGEQLLMGREIDPKTQRWWAQQSSTQHWLTPPPPSYRHAVPAALLKIDDFVRDAEAIWSRGIVFDIGNLESLYRFLSMPIPWAYNKPRDVRTITAINPRRSNTQLSSNLEAHNPVDDCVMQIYSLLDHWPAS